MNAMRSIAAALLAAATTVSAHANTPLSEQPDELLVTASPLGDVLQPVQLLSGDALRLKMAPTLGETLANEPGISSTWFGPAASRPVIRGLGESRVTMLNDRIASLDVSALSPDHAVTIEPLLAESIEIIRGPATLLYGSNAAGGIVNVNDNRIPTAMPEQALSGAFELRGDTAADERAIVGRLDGGTGRFAWHLNAYDRETDDLRIAGFATADPDDRPEDERKGRLENSFSDSSGYTGGASWIGDRGYLGAAVGVFRSRYGLPGPEEDHDDDEDEEDLFDGPFLRMKQTRVDVRGNYGLDAGFVEQFNFALGFNNYEHEETEPDGDVATRFDNEQWQVRVEAVHRPLAGFRGAFGVQFDDRDFSAVGEEAFVTPTSTTATGFFVVEERGFDWGLVSVGARIESLRHRNDTLTNFSNTAVSLAAGAELGLGQDHALVTNLSYTQRNPETEELYSDGAHLATRQFEVGLLATPDGRATSEDSINLDVGLKRKTGDLLWEVTLFYYDIADYIYQDLTGAEIDELPEAVYTQADAEFYGAEASLSMPLWQAGAWPANLRLFGDTVTAELKDGSKLPRIPPWRAGADLSLGNDPWSMGLEAIYHASQSDISSFNTSSYTLVNLNLVYRATYDTATWEVFLRGTNLTDENARKSTSFLAAYAPLPARSLHAGVRLAF